MANIQELDISSLRINYIFSFFLETKSTTGKKDRRIIDWKIKNKENSIGVEIEKKLQRLNKYLSVELHESEEKEPLNIRSAIYFHFPHLSIKKQYISAEFFLSQYDTNKFNGRYQINIALFESGMGIMWIAVEINNEEVHKLSKEEITQIARKDNILFLKDDGADKFNNTTPYEIFYTEINDLTQNLTSCLSETQYNNLEYTWNSIFWQDQEKSYNRGQKICQEPSIAILIKSSNYLKVIEESTEEFEYYVSSILHGTLPKDMDISHAKEHMGEKCMNLYPNKKFMTFLHGNCILVFHNSEYENNTPRIEEFNDFKEFITGLFRSYCAIRGRWHMYNILNENLDKNLTQVAKIIDWDPNGLNFTKELEKASRFKAQFLYYLNSEDPFVRSIGLSPFSNLYKLALKLYDIDELKSNITYKLNEYSKLLQNVHTLQYLTGDSIFTKQKSKKKHKLIYGRFTPIILSLIIFSLSMGARFYISLGLFFKISHVTFLILSIIIFVLGIFRLFVPSRKKIIDTNE